MRTKGQRRHRKWKRQQRIARFEAWVEEMRPMYARIAEAMTRKWWKQAYRMRWLVLPIIRRAFPYEMAGQIVTVTPMEVASGAP